MIVPEFFLNFYIERYPKASECFESAYIEKMQCFESSLPFFFLNHHLYNKACLQASESANINIDQINLFDDFTILMTVMTWRYMKNIYHMDEKLLSQVIQSKIPQALPSKVLLRLPQQCLFIQLPFAIDFDINEVDELRHCNTKKITSFFVTLLDIGNNHSPNLSFLLITETGRIILQLMSLCEDDVLTHSIYSTIEKNIDAFNPVKNKGATSTQSKINQEVAHQGIASQAHSKQAKQLACFVKIVLFMCQDASVITNHSEPETKPSNATLKKVEKSFRLFPSQKIQHFTLGDKLAEEMKMDGKTHANGETKDKVGYWDHQIYEKGENAQYHKYKWINPAF